MRKRSVKSRSRDDVGMSRPGPVLSNVIRAGVLVIAGLLGLTEQFWAALSVIALGVVFLAWEFYGGTTTDAIHDVRSARKVAQRRRGRERRIAAKRQRRRR